MTINNLKQYVEREYNSTIKYLESNPFSEKPIETLHHTETMCFGAVEFYLSMYSDEYDEVDKYWQEQLEKFRDYRMNHALENFHSKVSQ